METAMRAPAPRRRVVDITGRRFGRWTVIMLHPGRSHQAYWVCRCDCGVESVVLGAALRSGTTRSCGCLRRERRVIDLAGIRYGRWTVIRQHAELSRRANWVCRCDCGVERVVAGLSLRSGISRSCGCLRRKFDLAGQRFGRWLVIGQHPKIPPYGPSWLCRCNCGAESVVL